jgi:hypothetical protein
MTNLSSSSRSVSNICTTMSKSANISKTPTHTHDERQQNKSEKHYQYMTYTSMASVRRTSGASLAARCASIDLASATRPLCRVRCRGWVCVCVCVRARVVFASDEERKGANVTTWARREGKRGTTDACVHGWLLFGVTRIAQTHNIESSPRSRHCSGVEWNATTYATTQTASGTRQHDKHAAVKEHHDISKNSFKSYGSTSVPIFASSSPSPSPPSVRSISFVLLDRRRE